MAHAEAVEETAALLAVRYEVDVEAARMAGLLHDWCKDMPREELMTHAIRLGIHVTDVDLARPYLLHGPVAAYLLAARFPGLDPAVIRAVEVHTFGAPEMSDLDRVVYVADMIEPRRAYKGVAKLRKAAAHASLAELFELAYARSIAHIVKGRRPLHPRTLAVWNALTTSRTGGP